MQRLRLGMITPSSNTVLEPACAAMLAGLPHISAHFARVSVTRIGLDPASDAQFDPAAMLQAAELLADARVHAICWNGTSASWLGLDRDTALCAAITQRTGLPATSASLATIALFRRAGAARFGLVTPYTGDVQARIVAQYAALGFECVAERHAGLADNWAFAALRGDALGAMVREVARAAPDAISILCTNLDGAKLAVELEAETCVPIYDSTASALWAALHVAGADPSQVRGWGSPFAREPVRTSPPPAPSSPPCRP